MIAHAEGPSLKREAQMNCATALWSAAVLCRFPCDLPRQRTSPKNWPSHVKAPEDWRTPKAPPSSTALRTSARFWSAAVLCRFPFNLPRQCTSRKSWPSHAKAPEDWRTPKAPPSFTAPRTSARFWSAAVLCRFPFNLPRECTSRKSWPSHVKAPEDWRTPKASPSFTAPRTSARFWSAAVLCRFRYR